MIATTCMLKSKEQRWINDILMEISYQNGYFAAAVKDQFVLMDDYVKPYRARSEETILYTGIGWQELVAKEFFGMIWSVYLVDMYPAEHAWVIQELLIAYDVRKQLNSSKALFHRSGRENPNVSLIISFILCLLGLWRCFCSAKPHPSLTLNCFS